MLVDAAGGCCMWGNLTSPLFPVSGRVERGCERASEAELQAVGPRRDLFAPPFVDAAALECSKALAVVVAAVDGFHRCNWRCQAERETSKTGDGKSWIEADHVQGEGQSRYGEDCVEVAAIEAPLQVGQAAKLDLVGVICVF